MDLSWNRCVSGEPPDAPRRAGWWRCVENTTVRFRARPSRRRQSARPGRAAAESLHSGTGFANFPVKRERPPTGAGCRGGPSLAHQLQRCLLRADAPAQLRDAWLQMAPGGRWTGISPVAQRSRRSRLRRPCGGDDDPHWQIPEFGGQTRRISLPARRGTRRRRGDRYSLHERGTPEDPPSQIPDERGRRDAARRSRCAPPSPSSARNKRRSNVRAASARSHRRPPDRRRAETSQNNLPATCAETAISSGGGEVWGRAKIGSGQTRSPVPLSSQAS